MSTSTTQAAARGTLASILLRIISFICTQYTLRTLDPETLGRASIQLELLLTTVLFISREGFRLALTKDLSPESWSVAWWTIPFSTTISSIALVWHLWRSTDEDYRVAGMLFCIACAIEGASEPAILLALRSMNVTLKASAEGVATVAKTIATVAALQSLPSKWHVTAFGLAQLVYGIVYASVLLRSTYSELREVSRPWPIDRSTANMVAVYTLQGLFKHLLTEGDRIILTLLSASYDQGVYAMASAYGSIAARILLQPLEENARLLWSRLTQESLENLKKTYITLVKLVLYIGLLFSCLATNYTSILLKVMAGRKWGTNEEAIRVLSAFCIYTAFMAANGMTEAFVYAVATSAKDMGKLSIAHSFVGVAFAAIASVLVAKIGTVGLVIANCIAMSIRTAYSFYFTSQYFAERQKKAFAETARDLFKRVLPSNMVLALFAVSFIGTRQTNAQIGTETDVFAVQTLYHLIAAVISVVAIVAAVVRLERGFLTDLRTLVRSKKDD